MGNLSGADWWYANEGRFPNSKDVEDLDEKDFRGCARKFIDALEKNKNVHVKVTSTRRHPTRAYLMHFSWDIAEGKIDPAKVSHRRGVDIKWDHGDLEASVEAAREMVKLFNLAYRPSLTSNHMRGTAIDMCIVWKGEFTVQLRDGRTRKIGGPCNGAENRDLHEVGALFGVHKKVDDKPHWSHNGK